MVFVTMLWNVVIKNGVVISEIWIWLCGKRETEDNPYTHPPSFIDKGTYNIQPNLSNTTTLGTYIKWSYYTSGFFKKFSAEKVSDVDLFSDVAKQAA